MSLTFIPDGYTQPGRVEAVERLCGRVDFVYRPLPAPRAAVLNKEALNIKDSAKQEKRFAEIIAGQVQEWDITDPQGAAVEVTADNVQKLPPYISGRIYRIIMGIAASDAIEDAHAFDEQADAKN